MSSQVQCLHKYIVFLNCQFWIVWKGLVTSTLFSKKWRSCRKTNCLLKEIPYLKMFIWLRFLGSASNIGQPPNNVIKLIHSEEATKFSPYFWLYVHRVKSERKISQNFEAFSEYMNFKKIQFQIKKTNLE